MQSTYCTGKMLALLGLVFLFERCFLGAGHRGERLSLLGLLQEAMLPWRRTSGGVEKLTLCSEQSLPVPTGPRSNHYQYLPVLGAITTGPAS
jgi:hypothetical protein